MALLTVQVVSTTGIIPTYVAAAGGGDTATITGAGQHFLHVKNGGGSSISVTLDSVVLCSYGVDHDLITAVGAGAEKMIGPIDRTRYGDTIAIAYSGVTTVTIGVFRIA